MHSIFLSCDWGTSSFRLRLVDAAQDTVLAETCSGEGISTVYAQWKKAALPEASRVGFYRSVIAQHIKKIEQLHGSSTATIPVMVSGMASASIGMVELPYARLPLLLTGEDLQYKKIPGEDAFEHDLLIMSGACTSDDVMRGEETQLIGCAGNTPIAQQLFIFTGTHSKHVMAVNGCATSLVTYMTGEFFELLSSKSMLSNSITVGGNIDEGNNRLAFEQGVQHSFQQNLLHYSFRVRTNQLFHRMSARENYFYLSGLLIGTELNHLTGQSINVITLVGAATLVVHYRVALAMLGIDAAVHVVDASTATIQGQTILYERIYLRSLQ